MTDVRAEPPEEGRAAPPAPPHRARARLASLVGDDAWSREFLAELDHEFRERVRRDGRRAAGRWYRIQAMAPQTWRFILLMKRRESAREEGTMRGSERSGLWSVEGWAGDLRQAARGLVREWRMAAFIVLTLSLGIAANSAMFGVADRLFLAGPDHVAEPDRLVRFYLKVDGAAEGARTAPFIPYLTADAIRREADGIEAAALYRNQEMVVGFGQDTQPLKVTVAGEGYFDALGVTPYIGHFLTADGTGAAEAVVSHNLWMRAFNGSPDVLGRTVDVGPEPHAIVGVAPRGFTGVHMNPMDLWISLPTESAGSRNWFLLGRLGPGLDGDIGRSRVSETAQAVHARTDPGRFFGWAKDGVLLAEPIGYDDSGQPPAEAAVARLLVGVAGLILIIGMANVVSLLLARLTRRRREVAVRLALGSGRARLARLLLSETLALAAVAGLASLPVAYGATVLLRRVLLPDVAWTESPLGVSTLLLTAAVALVTGLVVALLPLRHAGRANVSDDLRAGSRGGGLPASRLHLSLASAQVMLSAALLLGAGLFMKSFWNLRLTDLGVDADKVVAVNFRALNPHDMEEFDTYRRALDVARNDPSVESAALTLGLPFLINFGTGISVPGLDSIPQLPGGGPFFTGVGDGYFQVMGTQVVQGREFTAQERASDEPVIMVSEAMAAALWPGRIPLGECVRIGGSDSPCRTVVGVVEDVHRVGFREPPSMQYYVPLAPGGSFGGLTLILRARSLDAATLARLGTRLEDADPVIAWADTRPLASALDSEIRPWYLGATVLGMASLVALLVSLVGVYGVLAYLVEQRRREMGIRIALGASRSGIRTLVVTRGLTAAGVGLVLGLGVTLLSRRWIDPLLFETSATDPVVVGSVAGLMLLAALAACLVPAHRAAGVAPAVCLREE